MTAERTRFRIMSKLNYSKASIGAVMIGIPAVIGLASLANNDSTNTETPEAYTNSRYLNEKEYLDCKNTCSDLGSGYKWAKTNNVCDADYDRGMSKAYNLGVQARAWDDCAYSNDGKPI